MHPLCNRAHFAAIDDHDGWSKELDDNQAILQSTPLLWAAVDSNHLPPR